MKLADEIQAAVYSAPVLVVDDDAVTRAMIEMTLRDNGFTSVLCVEDAARAMEQMESFAPDLVIMDIFMARMSGLECCEWIRENPKWRDLPVLMLTAVSDETLRFKSFEAGANDFVSKPLHPKELCGRVNVHLLNRLTMKNLRRYRDRLEREMQGARDLQCSILPSREDVAQMQQQYMLDIASHYQPSSEIGGDFWGVKNLYPHLHALWIADFSGHGVTAALNAFRLQAYLHDSSSLSAYPGSYLSGLNEKLLKLWLRGQFATMFYGIVDTRGNQLHYACACNPHPFILRRDGRVETLDGSGAPLGISMQYYPTRSIAFEAGDTLMLYSDTLIESSDAEGRFIAPDQIAALLSAHRGESAMQIKDALMSYFTAVCGTELTDDLTLCLCQRID